MKRMIIVLAILSPMTAQAQFMQMQPLQPLSPPPGAFDLTPPPAPQPMAPLQPTQAQPTTQCYTYYNSVMRGYYTQCR